MKRLFKRKHDGEYAAEPKPVAQSEAPSELPPVIVTPYAGEGGRPCVCCGTVGAADSICPVDGHRV